MLDDDLVDQDLHSTFEIVLRLENRFGRIVRLSLTVHLPIEIASVTLLICVRKLQQSLAAHSHPAYFIAFRAFWIGVPDGCVWIQAGFSTRKCLKKVSPKCAFVGFSHLIKSRAESPDTLWDLRGKHSLRHGPLDDPIPLWIPGGSAKFDLLLVDRGRRGWIGGLRVQGCGHSDEKYETHDERCL